tara:strand:+ start:683 stop:1114 length:432 start_codon:yes stop_codon:yes gene_type:complete
MESKHKKICDAYMELRGLVKKNPELLHKLNELRAFALGSNCPSCTAKANNKFNGCESCSELNSKYEKMRLDRMNKLKTLSRLRKKIAKMEDRLDFWENEDFTEPKSPARPDDQNGNKLEMADTWEENAFAQALHTGAFSFPRH